MRSESDMRVVPPCILLQVGTTVHTEAPDGVAQCDCAQRKRVVFLQRRLIERANK